MWPVEDRRSGGRKLVVWKVSWQGSRVSPLDHPQSITQTLTGKKKFVIKRFVTSKKFCPEKKNSWTKSCDSNYTNL